MSAVLILCIWITGISDIDMMAGKTKGKARGSQKHPIGVAHVIIIH
jgi:hypothetical protein